MELFFSAVFLFFLFFSPPRILPTVLSSILPSTLAYPVRQDSTVITVFGEKENQSDTNERVQKTNQDSTMQLHRLAFALLAMVALSFAEEADPCLAEDYAEANCAL